MSLKTKLLQSFGISIRQQEVTPVHSKGRWRSSGKFISNIPLSLWALLEEIAQRCHKINYPQLHLTCFTPSHSHPEICH
jgi:hypothetical protein